MTCKIKQSKLVSKIKGFILSTTVIANEANS